jgi:hypothetical protein
MSELPDWATPFRCLLATVRYSPLIFRRPEIWSSTVTNPTKTIYLLSLHRNAKKKIIHLLHGDTGSALSTRFLRLL